MSRSLTTRAGITTTDKQLALPGGSGLSSSDWEALRAGCALAWPELTWVLYEGTIDQPSIMARKKRGNHFVVLQIWMQQHNGSLCVTLNAPERLPLRAPWEQFIHADLAVQDVPKLLPNMLADARAWWLDVTRRRRAS